MMRNCVLSRCLPSAQLYGSYRRKGLGATVDVCAALVYNAQ
jgi:hypothetical protein